MSVIMPRPSSSLSMRWVELGWPPAGNAQLEIWGYYDVFFSCMTQFTSKYSITLEIFNSCLCFEGIWALQKHCSAQALIPKVQAAETVLCLGCARSPAQQNLSKGNTKRCYNLFPGGVTVFAHLREKPITLFAKWNHHPMWKPFEEQT